MYENFISKDDFDWEYYMTKNDDIRRAGLCNLDKCYRHWITNGCHENRWVRSIHDMREKQVQLRPNEHFVINMSSNTSVVNQKKQIELGFKIAIMIHVFDVTMLRFFISYLNELHQSYSDDNFDIYFNIVEENNPYQGNLQEYVKEQLRCVENQHVLCDYSENRGGDIGGFLLLSKRVIRSSIDYRYVMFVHSKSKKKWRIDLCRCLFGLTFEQLDKIKDFGMISAKRWIYNFDPVKQPEEYQRFRYHLVDLCNVYEIPSSSYQNGWQFVAGTMFLLNTKIIQYIVGHNIDHVYCHLNTPSTVDINWVTIVNELRKDMRGTVNDYQYRLRYHKSLCSDYMVEHTYERILGLLCQHMGLKLIGQ
jgi:hypothetical protein